MSSQTTGRLLGVAASVDVFQVTLPNSWDEPEYEKRNQPTVAVWLAGAIPGAGIPV
jgi:hypothetical protein